MFRPFIILLLSLFFSTLSLSAPVYAPGTIVHSPRLARAPTWVDALPRRLRRFLTPGQVEIEKNAVPATGLTTAALGHCFYVGSDFLMHDCNALVDVQAASLNSARTPEQKAIFAKASASLAAKLAAASAAAAGGS